MTTATGLRRRTPSGPTATVPPVTLYLVRHAHAGTRGHFDGPDLERPLSAKGGVQAEALRAALAEVEVERALSSRALRCQQTLGPLARQRGLDVEVDEALTEGAKAKATTRLLWQLATDGVDAVLSSHGDIIPAALASLGDDGVDVGEPQSLPKGTYYVLDVTDGAITRARFVDPRP